MWTSAPDTVDSHRPKILRVYNIYRVVLGFFLTLLTSSALRDGLIDLRNADLYESLSWIYLIVNVLIALLLHQDRKSTRLNSSHVRISYAVFCLKKKKLQHH